MMMRSNRPSSKTAHVIVKIPIVERPGSLFPLLVLPDGSPSLLAASYARSLQEENWSSKKVYEAIAAVGRLYDFYQIKLNGTAQEPWELRMMLRQFAEARLNGTLQPNGGDDPSGLNWRQVQFNTAKKDVLYISGFSSWLAGNFGTQELNPLEKKYLSSLREAYETSIRMSTSLLAHLSSARADRNLRPQFKLHNNTGAHLRDVPDSFPPDKVIELIEAASNPRDKMILILMAFGSLRISEVAHLFLEDLMRSFRDTKSAYVALGHPVNGYYEWVDHEGRSRGGTRAEYLMEMYSRVPRNRMEGKAEYAGWKGMEFGDAKHRGFVHWSCEDAGLYFRQLFHEYFDEVFRDKPEGWPGHPYAWIKMDRDHYGEPLTIANIANQFYATCEKIGLDRRQSGINPHGLRHFYGFYNADVLSIKLENLQKHMHHASPLSTLVYYHVRLLTIRDRLIEAQRGVEGQNQEKLAVKSEPEAIIPTNWHASAHDPFGLLDYFRKRSLKSERFGRKANRLLKEGA